MPQIVDQFGNPFHGALDTIGGENLSDEGGRTYVQNLSSNGAFVEIGLNGAQTATFDVRTGAGSLTYVFEGSQDGINYDIPLTAFVRRSAVGATISAEVLIQSVTITTTVAATYTVGVTGLRRVRLRIFAFTSGSINVAARASVADFMIYTLPMPATLAITVTAAANAGATLTLPAAGVGLFHYITGLYIARTATAALAGSATLIITTTNLPGTMAFSVGNAMVAGGTQRDVELQPAQAIKSLLANTATTFVMPVPGAAVLWRAYCFYYVGA